MKLKNAGLFTGLFFVAATCFSGLSIQAQDKDWRPITSEDVQLKTPKVDPNADAEALIWEVRIDDSSDSDLSRRYYVRVKIFTERGREKYSKFDIPFTKGTKIKDLAARVIKADGSIVDVPKSEIFEREIVKANNIKVKAKSFAVPNIEPGVIIEYKYKETTEDAGAMGMRLQFQREIPVQNLSYYYKPHNGEPNYQSYNFKDVKFIKDKDGFYLASRTNVPALKEEPQMPPEDNIRAWMLLTGSRFALTDVSEFSVSFTIKDPRIPSLYWGGVSTEWAGLTKLMSKKSDDVKKAAELATAGASTPEEKLRKIYEFCQTQIANTTYDPTITAEQRAKLPQAKTLNDVLKRKSGSSMYIDLLFGAMATAAGFESRVTLMSDRSEIFFDPDRMANEKLIHPGGVAVKVDDDWKVFNPGTRFAPYGMLPWWEEGAWALMIGEKNYVWRENPLTSEQRSMAHRTGKFNLLEDGTLEGSVVVEYSGHDALNYRLENYDEAVATREENLKNAFKSNVSSIEISNISIENVDDASKPLTERFNVRIPNYAQRTGKRIFLQPGFFEYGEKPVFANADRQYDIFFRYPWSEKDEIEITYPKSYDLDNADAPGQVADPSKIGLDDISIRVDKQNNLLKYERKFHFGAGPTVLFKPNVYQPLKNLFDAFHKADSHTITLKQK